MSSVEQKMSEIFERLRTAVSYSLPAKLVLGFVFTALGSAGVLGLLSEFAVYNYALDEGVRLPVEGIPYIRPTVTFVSLIILFSAAFGFIAVYIFAKTSSKYLFFIEDIVRWILSKINFYDSTKSIMRLNDRMRDAGRWKAFFISFFSSLAIVFILSWAVPEFIEKRLTVTPSVKFSEVLSGFYPKLALFILAFVVYWSAFRPSFIKYVAGVSATAIVALIVGVMFYSPFYSKFLYATGFGGGRDVVIFPIADEAPISGNLIIKSNDFYIVMLNDQEILEFPVNKTKKIEYLKIKDVWTTFVEQ